MNAPPSRTRPDERAEGIAWARAWRERRRAYFDALYGPQRDRCAHCGKLLALREE